MSRVPEHLSPPTARIARAAAEERFGGQLEGWIRRAGISITEVADRAGIKRPHLYDYLAGARAWKAAWLPLLPPEVLRAALEDLAGAIGYELRPKPGAGEVDAHVSAIDLVQGACSAMSAVTESQRDGRVDRQEAIAELEALRRLEHLIAERREVLRVAITEGVVTSAPAGRA